MVNPDHTRPSMAGDWKEATDPKGRVYYYNAKTGKSQWEKPNSLLTVQERQLLEHGWRSSKDKDGRQYYYNSDTGATSWEIPSFTTEEEEVAPESNESSNEDVKYTNHSKILNASTLPLDEAEKQFMEMLKDNHVDSTWSFSRIIKELSCQDPRYWVVDDNPIWKQQMFEKYLSNRSEAELLREHAEINKFRDAFLLMLKSKPEIRYYTRWGTAKRLISNEPIYKHSVVSEKIKKRTFQEFVGSLQEAHSHSQTKLKEQALKELREYLEDIIIPAQSDGSDLAALISWNTLVNEYLFEKNKRFMANKHFKILTHEDVLKEYLKIIDSVKGRLNDKLIQLQEHNYTQDRIARDNFKELLQDPKVITIRANTRWKDVYAKIQHDKRFLDMLGRNGSSALDLYLDVLDEKNIAISAQRSIAQQILIDKEYQWHDSIEEDIKPIKDILNKELTTVDSEDLEIIVKQIIRLRQDKLKEQEAIQKKLEEQKTIYFKSMLWRYFRGLNSNKPEKWQDIRDLIKDKLEFQELGDDEDTRIRIFEQVKAEMTRKKGEIQSKQPVSRKRPLVPSVELDY